MDDHPLVDRVFDLMQKKLHVWDAAELRNVVIEVCRDAAAYKPPSFSSENEIRLVAMLFDAHDLHLKPQYHVAKERIKKYYPLDFERMCRRSGVKMEELITEIMVGLESTQSPPILRDYLSDLGLKKLGKNISTSDCPLRSKM